MCLYGVYVAVFGCVCISLHVDGALCSERNGRVQMDLVGPAMNLKELSRIFFLCNKRVRQRTEEKV